MTLGFHSKINGLNREILPSLKGASIFVGTGNADSLAVMDEARAALGDQCIFVFRWFDREQAVWNQLRNLSPQAAANSAMDDIRSLARTGYSWLYWQVMNEPGGEFENYEWWAEFNTALIGLAVRYHLRVVTTPYGWGNPKRGVWPIHRPMFEALKAAGKDVALFSLHNYWWLDVDPNEQDIFMRWKECEAYCKANGFEQVFADRVVTEFGKDMDGWRAVYTPAQFAQKCIRADALAPGVPKAIYDLSNLPDDRGSGHDYSVQDNYVIGRGKEAEVIEPYRVIMEAIAAGASAPAPTPPPITPDNGRRKVIQRVNIRAEPSSDAIKYGELWPSKYGTFVVVDPEHAKNGYVKWAPTGLWLFIECLEKV